MITLASSVALSATTSPGRVAIIDEEREITYSALAGEAARLAQVLKSVSRGRPVGIALKNRIEHLVAIIAADQAGLPVAPLDPRWPGPRMERVLDLLGVRSIVVGAGMPGDIWGSREIVVVDEAGICSSHQQGTEVSDGELHSALDDGIQVFSLTGGTSGQLKAIAISRSATIARIVAQIIELGVRREHRFLAMTPLFHGAARSLALAHLWIGASVQLEPAFDRGRMLELMSASCNTTFVVPTMIHDLLEVGVPLEGDRRFICSGAPLLAEVAWRFRSEISTELFNYFASVDAGGIAILPPIDAANHAETVGRPTFGTRLTVLDDDGSPVESGHRGRISVSGPSVCSAILVEGKEPLQTSHSITTSDRGYIDSDGRLVVLGRADDVIITGGVNVDPVEIETAFARAEGISQLMAVGLPDERWGQRVVLVYTVEGGEDVDESALAETCALGLPPERRPKEYIRVESLPVTALGKPDRRAMFRQLTKQTK